MLTSPEWGSRKVGVTLMRWVLSEWAAEWMCGWVGWWMSVVTCSTVVEHCEWDESLWEFAVSITNMGSVEAEEWYGGDWTTIDWASDWSEFWILGQPPPPPTALPWNMLRHNSVFYIVSDDHIFLHLFSRRLFWCCICSEIASQGWKRDNAKPFGLII